MLSGQPTSPDPSILWISPYVRQEYSPETHEVDHGFGVSQQITPPRSESNDVDQQDILGRTLLHRMVSIDELDRVKDTLSRGARIDIEDNEGNQALHLAAMNNFPHILRYLLKSGANLNAKGASGRTAVHLALGHARALRTLLGAHPNLSTPDNDGDTALHAALRKSPYRRPRTDGVIVKLLCRGANVNAVNNAGVTPFHMAMKYITRIPKHSYVPLFLDHDADINLKTDSGEWPFAILLKKAWALRYDWSKEVLMFLRKGADPNTRVSTQDSLLYVMLLTMNWDFLTEYDDIVLQLCKTADIDTSSAEGDFPLHCVMRSGFQEGFVVSHVKRYLQIVEALIHRGSDPSQANGKGERPLQILLSRNGHFPTIKSALTNLLDNGADPMLADSSGNLPIYSAYRLSRNNDRDELVRILTDAFIARPEKSDGGNNSQPIPVWWQTYRAFRLQHRWSDEGRQLLEAASTRTATGMPQDVAEHLPKLLISFAAEAKLHAAKLRFSSGEIAWNSTVESPHVVRILRDCKIMGIDLDVSWYHFLLDILP